MHVAFSQYPDARHVILDILAVKPVSHVTFASEPNVESLKRTICPSSISGLSPQPTIYSIRSFKNDFAHLFIKCFTSI